MPYDRKRYFDSVRASLFPPSMTQQQVDGQEAILLVWEKMHEPLGKDVRYLSYCLGTAKHESASTMWPIEEYGKGSGMSYGKADPETGQTYYGRGLIQLTWRENYARATKELHLGKERDLEWHAQHALDPDIASAALFQGCEEGWFRKGHSLPVYFNATINDPYEAREIVNGDKHIVPKWSGGVSIGNLIADYHKKFLTALNGAYVRAPPGAGDI